ncbi:LytTR family DNA-binding domain-containing protein [Asticcacaulis sp. BYS171W]|uniref:LytTR family DNA-binding domain-containing protein n=1 Tax=Asticcacaulis aquaticus TaxID=2984212 RepID=A0ABT5HVX1_9CAUL|nr:LytTR family DNA-binding domain-containing protein [Asticcacaulis aquaticus]MDC7684208.1 LytTR family DNA-binding domain-containing protein [Asticcacaulis aquaticus]
MKLPKWWPLALTGLIYAETVGFAATAARDLSGGTMSWMSAILWQGLNYGTWLPFAALVLWLARRLGLSVRFLAALYPAIGLYTLLHAAISLGLSYIFNDSSTTWRGWLYRLPIDVLIATAIAASIAALRGYRLAIVERDRAVALQAALDRAQTEPATEHRLWVSTGRRKTAVDLSEVEWFAAAGNYVVVNWAGREGLMRETLSALSERLDPTVFVRAHRASIVNLGKVRSTAILDDSWVLTLDSGAELAVSRTCRDAVLARLGHKKPA